MNTKKARGRGDSVRLRSLGLLTQKARPGTSITNTSLGEANDQHLGQLERIIKLTKQSDFEKVPIKRPKGLSAGPSKADTLRAHSIHNSKNQGSKLNVDNGHLNLCMHTKLALGVSNRQLNKLNKGKNVLLTESPFKRTMNVQREISSANPDAKVSKFQKSQSKFISIINEYQDYEPVDDMYVDDYSSKLIEGMSKTHAQQMEARRVSRDAPLEKHSQAALQQYHNSKPYMDLSEDLAVDLEVVQPTSTGAEAAVREQVFQDYQRANLSEINHQSGAEQLMRKSRNEKLNQPNGNGYNALTQPATSATQTSGFTMKTRTAINFYNTDSQSSLRPHESPTLKHLLSQDAQNQKNRSQILKQIRAGSGNTTIKNNASTIYTGLSRQSEQRTTTNKTTISKMRYNETQKPNEYLGLIRSKMNESKISSSTALIQNSKHLDMSKRSNAKLQAVLGQLSKSAYQFNKSQQNHFYKVLKEQQQDYQELQATEALPTSLAEEKKEEIIPTIPLKNVQTAQHTEAYKENEITNIQVNKVTFTKVPTSGNARPSVMQTKRPSQALGKQNLKLRRDTIGTGSKKPIANEEILETSENQFMRENQAEDLSSAEYQFILRKNIGNTFASVIDAEAKNKYIGCSKVQIDSTYEERQEIFTQSQIRTLFDFKDKQQEVAVFDERGAESRSCAAGKMRNLHSRNGNQPNSNKPDLQSRLMRKSATYFRTSSQSTVRKRSQSRNNYQSINGTKITDTESQLARFEKYCQRNCINRKLKFIGMEIGSSCIQQIKNMLQRNENNLQQSIGQILLRQNHIADEGAKIFAQILEIPNMQIVHLDLGQNRIGESGFISIFQALENNNSLVSLHLGNSEVKNRNKIGNQASQRLKQMLVNQVINESGVLAFLDLTNVSLGNQGAYNLAQGISKNKNIEELILSANDITHFGIDFLVTEGLNSNQPVSPNQKHNEYVPAFTGFDEAGKELDDPIPEDGLKHLDLSLNPIGNAGIEILSTFIKSKITTLIKLNVSDCKIKTKGAVTLFLAISRQTFLEELDLSKNDIGISSSTNRMYVNHHPSMLCTALEAGLSVSLTSLNLDMCTLCDQECTSISEAMMKKNHLKTLSMKSNKITSSGMNAISGAILHNFQKISDGSTKSTCMLESLDVSENLINDDCARDLVAAVKSKNTQLLKISIKKNQLMEAGAQLLDAIKDNRQIQRFDVEENHLDLKYVEQIESELISHRAERSREVVPLLLQERKMINEEYRLHWGKTQKALAQAKQRLIKEHEANKEEERLNEEREEEELKETEDTEQELIRCKKKARELDEKDERLADRQREIGISQVKEEKEKAVWTDKFLHQSYDNTDEILELQARLQERKAEHKKTKEALLSDFDYAHQAWKKEEAQYAKLVKEVDEARAAGRVKFAQ